MRFIAYALGIWGILGLIGLLIPGVDAWVLILPAIPIYLISSSFSDHVVTHGLLWDSAHGPPFLNTGGVIAVYVVPLVVAIFLLIASRKTS